LPLANASATSLAFFVFFGVGDGGAFDVRRGFDDAGADAAGFDGDDAGFADGGDCDAGFDRDGDAGFDGDGAGARVGTTGVPFDSRAGGDGGVDVGTRLVGLVRSFVGGVPMPRRGVFIVPAPSRKTSSSA
jgi:hypothetical protein